MPAIDLRSDTVTRPTPEMRRAIADAEVGDAVLGDDPSVNALEAYAAELLGKEAALFCPSGIMANQIALILLGSSGTEAIIEAGGHILNYEEAAAPALSGIQLRAVPTSDGIFTVADLVGAIQPQSRYLPRTSVLCLENSHNSAGGRVLPLERMSELAEVARAHRLRIHLDGARLPNAAAAAGTPMRAWAEFADTVMFSLSKGLGAPVGSILAGGAAEMEEGWRVRRRLGGGMRQAGVLAAAGLYALHNNMDRLADDHRRARELAAAANAIPGLSAAAPETNIVMIDLLDPRLGPEHLLPALDRAGVRMTAFGPRRLRAVTHLDVDDDGIARAAAAVAEGVQKLAPE